MDKNSTIIIFAMLVAAVLFSACIELKPVASLPTSVNVSIETGSGACAGMTEASCGAVIKEKRIQSGAWRCQGVEGPPESQAEYSGSLISNTYDLASSIGWECSPLGPGNNLVKSLGAQSKSGRTTSSRGGIMMDVEVSNADLNMTSITTRCSISLGCGERAIIDAYCDLGPRPEYKIGSTILALNRCPGLSSLLPSSITCTYFGLPWIMLPSFTSTTTANVFYADITSDSGDVDFSVTCNLEATYSVSYLCTNKRAYPAKEYRFNSCYWVDSSTVGTFQGGKMLTDFNVPREELNDLITGYYATGTNSMKQVPFFMLGQGPSFQDFEAAREMCNPFYEDIVNVSLGNLIFDPVQLKVQDGTEVCWKNDDSKNHTLMIDSSSSLQISKGETSCKQPSTGTHIIKDILTGYEDSVIISPRGDDTSIYVSSRLAPEYSVVESGKAIQFILNDPKRHDITLHLVDFQTGRSKTVEGTISITSTSTQNFSYSTADIDIPGLLGEQEVEDSSTGQTANFFVYSPEYKFTFGSGSDITPISKFIARPLGDAVCFTTSSTGLTLAIAIYSEDGWRTVYDGKPLEEGKECCYTPAIGGLYKASVQDGREVQFLISRQKPTATISIQEIGFQPESTSVNPTARLCLSNPAPLPRTVQVSGVLQEGTGITATIVPFSKRLVQVPAFGQDCSLVFKSQGAIDYRFDPDLGATGSLTLTSEETNLVKITSYGFNPPFLQATPGDQICITNTDTKDHTLFSMFSTSSSIPPAMTSSGTLPDVLSANDTVCFKLRNIDADHYFAIKHDSSGVNMMMNVFNDGEYGIIMTPLGMSPSRLNVPASTKEMTITSPVERHIPASMRVIRIVNRLNAPVQFMSEQDVTITANSITPSSVSSLVPLRMKIYNRDSSSHILDFSGSPGINIAPSEVRVSEFAQSGAYSIKDRTLQEKGSASDTVSINVGIDAAGSTAYLSTLSVSGTAGDVMSFNAPYIPGSFTFKESAMNTSATISFSSPPAESAQVPLLNETMDLPVQSVGGYIHPDILAKLREYSDRGLIPTIITNFRNVDVYIKYSSFTPENTTVTAGSYVKLKNTDNIDHVLNITKVNFSSICVSKNESMHACDFDPIKKACKASVIGPASQFCLQYEESYDCLKNPSRPLQEQLAYSCSKNPATNGCRFDYVDVVGNSPFCSISGTDCINATPGFICGWAGSNCVVLDRSADADDYTERYCNRESIPGCTVAPEFDFFRSEYSCFYWDISSSCQRQLVQEQDGWIYDFEGNYCNKTYSYTSESSIVPLAQYGEYSFQAMRDSYYIINSTRFGSTSRVDVSNLDSDVRVGYSQLSPELAQMAPWQRLEFNNFMAQQLNPSFIEKPNYGQPVSGTTSIPSYNALTSMPGESTYYPSGEGDIGFTFSELSLAKKLAVKVSGSPVKFNISLSSSGFNVSSVAMHKDSQVCISSDSMKQIRVLKGTETIDSGQVLGKRPLAEDACLPVYACQSSDPGMECKGYLNSTSPNCMYRVKQGDASKCVLNTTVAPKCSPNSYYANEMTCRLTSDKSKCEFAARSDAYIDPYKDQYEVLFDLPKPSYGIPAVCMPQYDSGGCTAKSDVSGFVTCGMDTSSGKCKFSPDYADNYPSYMRASFYITCGGNAYYYAYLPVSSLTIAAGDYLEYDILWTSSSDYIGVDLEVPGVATLRDSGSYDQNGISAHPASDISTYALNKWYHRKISLKKLKDQIVSRYYIVSESDAAGTTKTAYIANIKITNDYSGLRRTIYSSGYTSYSWGYSACTNAPSLSPVNAAAYLCQGTGSCSPISGYNDVECIRDSSNACWVGPLAQTSGYTTYDDRYCDVTHTSYQGITDTSSQFSNSVCSAQQSDAGYIWCGWDGSFCSQYRPTADRQCLKHVLDIDFRFKMTRSCSCCEGCGSGWTAIKPTSTLWPNPAELGSRYECEPGSGSYYACVDYENGNVYNYYTSYPTCPSGYSRISTSAYRCDFSTRCTRAWICRQDYNNDYDLVSNLGYSTSCSSKTSSEQCYSSSNGRCYYYPNYAAPQKQCTSFSNCPCVQCKNKYWYYGTSNIACTPVSGGGCNLVSDYASDLYWNPDTASGVFCRITYEPRCDKKPGYEGFECGCTDSPCTASSNCKFDQYTSSVDPTGSGWAYDISSGNAYPICDLKPVAGCETKPGVKGVACGIEDGACTVTEYAGEFCWNASAAGEGTYTIEDTSTGNRMDVKIYSQYDPLEVDLGKSYIIPDLIHTSPGSQTCFTSGDGSIHKIRLDGTTDLDIGTGFLCRNFTEGSHSAKVVDPGLPGVSGAAEIISDISNKTISVRQKVFEPDSAIIRPNSNLTFHNLDDKDHEICLFGSGLSKTLTYNLVISRGEVKERTMSPEISDSFSTIPEFQDDGSDLCNMAYSRCMEECLSDTHSYDEFEQCMLLKECNSLKIGCDTCEKKYDTLTFNLPNYLSNLEIGITLSGNGVVEFVGNGEKNYSVPEIISKCVSGETTTSSKRIYIPDGMINYGGQNKIKLYMCNCIANDYKVKIDVSYLWKDSAGCNGGELLPVIPKGTNLIVSTSPSEGIYSYWDSSVPRSFRLQVKNCDGADLSSIANDIGGYDRDYPEYDSEKCDSGFLEGCADYNPHGPATIAIVTTEEGLDFNNPDDLTCAREQIDTIHSYCPNCTAALMVGKMNSTKLDSILYNLRTGVYSPNYTEIKPDMVAHTLLLDEYSGCDFSSIMQDKANMSRLALYKYHVPSLLLQIGATGASDSCWTDEKIIDSYESFYSNWIPILAGSGFVGAAQYCFKDSCKLGDYGLLTNGGDKKAFTNTWLKDGCGGYYYNGIGLSLLTFSSTESNYSLCDPSKMFLLLQQMKCMQEDAGIK